MIASTNYSEKETQNLSIAGNSLTTRLLFLSFSICFFKDIFTSAETLRFH